MPWREKIQAVDLEWTGPRDKGSKDQFWIFDLLDYTMDFRTRYAKLKHYCPRLVAVPHIQLVECFENLGLETDSLNKCRVAA